MAKLEPDVLAELGRAWLDASPDPLFLVHTGTGEVVAHSAVAATTMGLSGLLIGRTLRDLFHPVPSVLRLLADAPGTTGLAPARAGLRLTCEEPRGPFDVVAFPLSKDRPGLLVVRAHQLADSPADLAWETAASNDPAEAEIFRLGLEASEVGVWDWLDRTAQFRWSPRCLELLGSPAEGVGHERHFFAHIHPEDRLQVQQAIERAYRVGGDGRFCSEYRYALPGQPLRWLRSRGRAFSRGTGPSRQVIRFIGTVEDITAHRATETRFRTLVDTIPHGVMELDAEGRICFANTSYGQMLGLDPEQLLGRFIWDREGLPAEIREEVRSLYYLALGNLVRPTSRHFRSFRSDGQPLFLRVDWNYLRTASDQVSGFVVVATDLTELQRASDRLRLLSERLLEVQEQERRHLARELHDEFGGSLTGILLTVDRGLEGPLTGVRPALEQVQAQAQDLTAQIRSLSHRLRPPMLDDLGLLPALLSHLTRVRETTGLRVDFHHAGLENRLPPAVETAVYRIVQEAVTNVARHASVRRVEVEAIRDEAGLHLVIADAGQGYDPQQVAGKLTMGLSGMQERAELLGGRFHVTTGPGKGTRVEVLLPLPQATVAQAGPGDVQ